MRIKKLFKGYYLPENKVLRFPNWIVFVDTETVFEQKKIRKKTKIPKFVDGERLSLFLGYCEIWRKAKRKRIDRVKKDYFLVIKEGEYYIIYYNVLSFFFKTKEEFLSKLLKHIKKNENAWILAYNMSFDFRILYQEQIYNQYLELEKWIVDSMRFYIKFKRRNGKGKLIFSDVMHYVGGRISLEKLAKKLGLESKLDILKRYGYDVSRIPEKELKEYVKRDVEIIRKYILLFIKFLWENKLGSWKMTLAGISFTIFRHLFMKKRPCRVKNEKYLEWIRKAYFGGRTEVFDLRMHYNVYYLDFNSLYPFVMKKYKFPIRLKWFFEAENLRDMKRLIKVWKMYRKRYLYIMEGLFYIPESLPYGILPVRVKNKVIFPVGYIYGVYASPEVEFLISKGGKVVYIRKIAFYQSDFLFRDFVDYFYKMKVEAKKQKDLVTYWNSKIIMNSLYGKFGQRQTIFKFAGYTRLHDGVHHIYLEDKEIVESVVIGKKVYIKDYEGFSKLSIPEIAIFVTSYARTELNKVLFRVKCIYCDTDSLVIPESELPKIKDLVNENELGKLKIEHKCRVFKANNPKDYWFIANGKKKEKLKGLGKNAKLIDNNTLYRLYEIKRSIGFRESLRYFAESGEIPVIFIKQQKRYKNQYEKGYVENNKIKPFIVDMRLMIYKPFNDFIFD